MRELRKNNSRTRAVAKSIKESFSKISHDKDLGIMMSKGKSFKDVAEKLLDLDPTNKKIYRNWLTVRFIRGEIRLEDSIIKEELSLFDSLKPKLDNADINTHCIKSFRTLLMKHTETDTQSNRGLERDRASQMEACGDIEVISKANDYSIKVPHTKDAAKLLGRGTKWCTSADNDNMFDNYNNDGPLYIISFKDGRKWQLHFESCQFMDGMDTDLSGKDSMLAKKLVIEALGGDISKSSGCARVDLLVAQHVLKAPFPQGEKAIATNPEYSCLYARYVLKAPFPQGEKTIATNQEYSYHYARDVLKAPIPQGEKKK